MHTLRLLRHAPTPATQARAFPADESVADEILKSLPAVASRLGAVGDCLSSPARRALQTAQGLRLSPQIDTALAECDFGSWRGRTVAEVEAKDPAAFALWLSNEDAAPHGGDSLAQMAERVRGFLDRIATGDAQSVTAITHGGLIKIAVALAMGAPVAAMWQVDCEPLSLTELRFADDRWRLVRCNVPLA